MIDDKSFTGFFVNNVVSPGMERKLNNAVNSDVSVDVYSHLNGSVEGNCGSVLNFGNQFAYNAFVKLVELNAGNDPLMVRIKEVISQNEYLRIMELEENEIEPVKTLLVLGDVQFKLQAWRNVFVRLLEGLSGTRRGSNIGLHNVSSNIHQYLDGV